MNSSSSRHHARRSRFFPALLVASLATSLLLGACATHHDRDDDPGVPTENPFKPKDDGPGGVTRPASDKALKLKADQLYRRGHAQLVNGEYVQASKTFDDVITRYPFTPYATQSQIEQIFANYRNYNTAAAGEEAERFMREHPRHPNADYVLYLKGLIAQSQDRDLLDYLPINNAGHDTSDKEQAFQDFALLLQRYPKTKYAWDARQRMVALRNAISDHEVEVVRFYMRRGAWLAAAKRAEGVIENYPGAPATVRALLLLKTCNEKLGLTDQVKQIDALIAANGPSIKAAKSPHVVTLDASQVPPPPAMNEDHEAAAGKPGTTDAAAATTVSSAD